MHIEDRFRRLEKRLRRTQIMCLSISVLCVGAFCLGQAEPEQQKVGRFKIITAEMIVLTGAKDRPQSKMLLTANGLTVAEDGRPIIALERARGPKQKSMGASLFFAGADKKAAVSIGTNGQHEASLLLAHPSGDGSAVAMIAEKNGFHIGIVDKQKRSRIALMYNLKTDKATINTFNYDANNKLRTSTLK